MNKDNLAPNAPKKNPEKTGVTLFALVGGFILLIIAIGVIYVTTRG